MRKPTSIPDDFPKAWLDCELTANELGRLYDVPADTIRNWRRKLGLAPRPKNTIRSKTHKRQTRPVPDGFLEDWHNYDLTKIQLQEKLSASAGLIRRWAKELNLPCRVEAVRKKWEQSQTWQKGRVEQHGYIFVRMPDHPYAGADGYVREHRLVMEKHIGRYLLPEECVHHKNHQRDDNRIENLELFQDASTHIRSTERMQFPEGVDVVSMYVDQKMSPNQIAGLLGCSPAFVRTGLLRLGVQLRKMRTYPDRETLLKMRQTMTVHDMAMKIGCPDGTLHHILRKNKIPSPKPGVLRKQRYPDDDTLRELRKSHTLQEIAAMYNVSYWGLASHATVRKIYSPNSPASIKSDESPSLTSPQ